MKTEHALMLWNDTAERVVGTDCDGNGTGQLTAFAGAAMQAGAGPFISTGTPGYTDPEVVKGWWKAVRFLREWADALVANIPQKAAPEHDSPDCGDCGEVNAKHYPGTIDCIKSKLFQAELVNDYLKNTVTKAKGKMAECKDYFEEQKADLGDGTVYDDCLEVLVLLRELSPDDAEPLVQGCVESTCRVCKKVRQMPMFCGSEHTCEACFVTDKRAVNDDSASESGVEMVDYICSGCDNRFSLPATRSVSTKCALCGGFVKRDENGE